MFCQTCATPQPTPLASTNQNVNNTSRYCHCRSMGTAEDFNVGEGADTSASEYANGTGGDVAQRHVAVRHVSEDFKQVTQDYVYKRPRPLTMYINVIGIQKCIFKRLQIHWNCLTTSENTRTNKQQFIVSIMCNSVQQCAIMCNSVKQCAIMCNSVQQCAIVCNNVQQCAIECNSVQQCAIMCNIVQ